MQRQAGIKHFTYYFRQMMKFYELKVQGVPQVLFILLLAVLFGIRVLVQPLIVELNIYYQQFLTAYSDFYSAPENIDAFMKFMVSDEYMKFVGTTLKVLGIAAGQYALSMLLSFFYLGAYLVDLEAREVSFAVYMKKFLAALPRFIGFQILFHIGVGILGLLFLMFISFVIAILPIMYIVIVFLPFAWLIVEVIFIFKEITLLDTGVGIFRNFALSWKLSAGSRFVIGKNIFFIVFLNMITDMLVVGSNLLLSLFIISFI